MGFFGGKIEGDETPEEAVKRETYEELHYKLKNPKLVMVQKFKDKHHDRTMYVFIERYDPTKKLVLGEGEGMKWLSLSEAEKLNIVEQDKEVLRYIKNKY